jgi:arginyl-tRNA synthetase
MNIKGKIEAAVKNRLSELGVPEANITVSHAPAFAECDLATNAAFVSTKTLKQSPAAVAALIAEGLSQQLPEVAEITVLNGYINFTLTRDFYTQSLADRLESGIVSGQSILNAGKEVMIEYTSPNLFKPLHIGNLVGNIIGESISRLLENSGATVHRLNYPSDIGLTVAKGVWGLKKHGLNPDDIAALGQAYMLGSAAYDEDEAAKAEIEAVNRALYAGSDSELSDLRARGIKTSLQRLRHLCDLLGTKFDSEFFESQVGETGLALVRAHLSDGIFEESNGAVIYRGEKVGLHTRVFINSQGLPTYEAKDLGNHELKDKAYPNWQTSIIVTGGEQSEYFKVLIAAIKEVFPEAAAKELRHIPTGFLTLSTGKMSSRKGNVLTGESLLSEMTEEAEKRVTPAELEEEPRLTSDIAVAALKYQILRQKVGMDIVFNKEQALSYEGDSGPYLQYTRTRISSVIEKATAAGIVPSVAVAPAVPYEVERVLARYEDVVNEATRLLEPHHLVTYLTALAGEFNSFYSSERIADSSDEFAPYKVALTNVVGETIEHGLWLLGISAPKRM